MTKSLIVVLIPSDQLRKKYPQLFHLYPEKDIASLTPQAVSFSPLETNPDVLLVKDTDLGKTTLERLQILLIEYSQLHIALHENSRFARDFQYDIETFFPVEYIAYLTFSRTDTDIFHQALNRLIDHIVERSSRNAYNHVLTHLRNCFSIDWDLEDQLRKPAYLEAKYLRQLPADTLILWNDDESGQRLAQIAGTGQIVLAKDHMHAAIHGKKQLLILAELCWEQRKASQFFGYNIARDLVAGRNELNILFISRLSRKDLLTVNNPLAQLMVPIFLHAQFGQRFSFSKLYKEAQFSKTKWQVIRQYFINRSGIIDKLLHDIQYLRADASTADNLAILSKLGSFSGILNADIMKTTQQLQEIIENGENERLPIHLSLLIEQMQALYEETLDKEVVTVRQSPSKIAIIDDDELTCQRLSEGLSTYFAKVETFKCAELAWKAITAKPRSFSAVIVDMELLDENGFWRPMMGFDFIEKLDPYPHIAINVLTGYSRRALTYVQGSSSHGSIRYLTKDRRFNLPKYWGFGQIAERLQEQIKERAKYLQGPQLGPWRNGLLHFYFDHMASTDGEKIWQEVYSVVDRYRNHQDISQIPNTFWNVGLKEFDVDKLRTVLIHRLIVLYHQFRRPDRVVRFQEDLRGPIGFRTNAPKSYFNSLLGFSAIQIGEEIRENKNGAAEAEYMHVIQVRHFFPEEKSWLKGVFPNVAALEYEFLIETVQAILSEQISDIERHKGHPIFAKLPAAIASFRDCRNTINTISEISVPSQSKYHRKFYDIAVEFDYYMQNHRTEIEKLIQSKENFQMLQKMRDFVRQFGLGDSSS